MTGQVFVTGMLRSGTTLLQTLLTNHPQLFVAYQPFHQLYVETKRLFLDEHGIRRSLPLDDGWPSDGGERAQFRAWLARRVFNVAESEQLSSNATSGKGCGVAGMQLPSRPGAFATIRESLHVSLLAALTDRRPPWVGSKEVLCEEYVPALADAGVKTVLVLRDPRGVIASANNGRYRDQVGDRYPLMMLVQLWRKSAAYWLKYRDHPDVIAVRFEDLATYPDRVLAGIAHRLGVDPFPPGIAQKPLLDHSGLPWKGNSSFGDKVSVDSAAVGNWRETLREEDIRLISACTMAELQSVGYDVPEGLGEADIREFREDEEGVRRSYLQSYRLDERARAWELRRFQLGLASGRPDSDADEAARYFLFAEDRARIRRNDVR